MKRAGVSAGAGARDGKRVDVTGQGAMAKVGGEENMEDAALYWWSVTSIG